MTTTKHHQQLPSSGSPARVVGPVDAGNQANVMADSVLDMKTIGELLLRPTSTD